MLSISYSTLERYRTYNLLKYLYRLVYFNGNSLSNIQNYIQNLMLYIFNCQQQAIWVSTDAVILAASARHVIATNSSCLLLMIIQMCACSAGIIRLYMNVWKETKELFRMKVSFIIIKLYIIQSVW